MKNSKFFLYAGISFSVLIHGVLFFSFVHLGSESNSVKQYKASRLVPVTVKKAEVIKKTKKKKPVKKQVKKKKKPPVKINKKTKVNPAPVSHKRTVEKKVTKPEEIKPVFGVTKKTVENKALTKTGIGVRVGNTLMKEQEKEYTPPEKVRDYVTIPVFDLTTLPSFKVKITPGFPESLKSIEFEGEVYVSAEIDDNGVVTVVRIIKSDHELFSESVKKALLASRFSPATQNGEPVGTILDDLVYTFVLDD